MIKVHTQNERVEVGGNFQEALQMIKAIEGREYNPSTKTWTIPLTTQEFLKHAAFYRIPVDTNEFHYTSYGTPWENEDWNTQKQVWNAQSKVDRKINDAIWEAQRSSDEALRLIGITEQGLITFLLENCYDEEKILARVQFTSARKQEKVMKVIDEFWQIKSALLERGEQERAAIEEDA